MTGYDRRLLLLGPKRNHVLELWEVERYGADSFGDPDYVSVFGMRPEAWYARGVRLLGRTAVECTRDVLAKAIGADVARIASTCPTAGATLVVDPFCGSGNTLHWITSHVPDARGVGVELDPTVFDLTRRNLAALALPIEVVHADHRTALPEVRPRADDLVVTFVAPPWGEALSETAGLDLRRTSPPVAEILDLLNGVFGTNRLLCAIQVFERTDEASLEELRPRFDWSEVRIYDCNASGQNHGILLGTRGWAPDRRENGGGGWR